MPVRAKREKCPQRAVSGKSKLSSLVKESNSEFRRLASDQLNVLPKLDSSSTEAQPSLAALSRRRELHLAEGEKRKSGIQKSGYQDTGFRWIDLPTNFSLAQCRRGRLRSSHELEHGAR